MPAGAKLKVKDGEGVEVGEVIYEFHENIVERLPLVGWHNLGSGDRKLILQNIVKRNLVKDEIFKKGSFFSNITLKSPGTGKCLGVDEFGNIELETEKQEIYLAPISAKKVRVEKEKVIFELKGTEFVAEGVNQLKSWGNFDGLIVDDLGQIDNRQNGQVVIIKSSLESVVKAEAVGAMGLILVDIERVKEFEESDIPVVSMKEDDVLKMIKFIDNQQVKIWINATASKVVVVLE